MHSVSEPAPAIVPNAQTEPVGGCADRWTLIRNARQLLTLRGPGGPRSGPAMAELGVVPKGAVLIRNGIIREAGPTRRVENLAEARNALEIDASGRILMPAFVDADVALLNAREPDEAGPDSIRLMSNRRLLGRVFERSEEYGRYGCVTVGAHARCTADLRNITRLLRTHRKVQRAPLRILSIFSPIATPELVEEITSRWLPTVMSQKLASIAELTVGGTG